MESERKTIVLVEDQEILARLIGHKLEQHGYAVKVAFDGAEGLRLIRSVKPDLVLLDMGLPRIDGFGVLEALRAEHLLPNLPIIIISNTGEDIEIERARTLGVRDYLIKINFDPDELVAKVTHLFDALPPSPHALPR
ncbi:MAG: response regulator [bacterium]|nr:response regulator [bacterium]